MSAQPDGIYFLHLMENGMVVGLQKMEKWVYMITIKYTSIIVIS